MKYCIEIANQQQWKMAFFEACQKGRIEEIHHLCQKKYLDLGWADIHIKDEEGFRRACFNGHLNVVKYLLTSPELIEAGHTFADLHAWNDDSLSIACETGHLNVVQYLLTSPELRKAGHSFADLHANNDWGFRATCYYGHLDVLKYLLTSPELIEAGHTWADVHADNDDGFYDACYSGCWEVVRWLILEHGLEKTPRIQEIIQSYPQAQEWFRVREELQEIQKSLMNPSLPLPLEKLENAHQDQKFLKKARKL